MKWEYAIFEVEQRLSDSRTPIEALNIAGAQGWEIITAHPIDSGWLYHAKRPVAEPSAASVTIDLGQPADKPAGG